MKATVCVAAIKCPRCKMIYEYKVFTNLLHITNQYDIKKTETNESTPHNAVTTTLKV